jgi:hypothetical protein
VMSRMLLSSTFFSIVNCRFLQFCSPNGASPQSPTSPQPPSNGSPQPPTTSDDENEISTGVNVNNNNNNNLKTSANNPSSAESSEKSSNTG